MRMLRLLAGATSFVAAISGASAQQRGFCNQTFDSPSDAQKKISSLGRYHLVQLNERYAAYADSANQSVWTLTVAAHPAHPAVVCRTVVEENGEVRIKTEATCGGAKEHCDAMMREFAILNEQMQQQLERDAQARRQRP